MSLSAKEAADQVGLSKAGILKAVKTGKVSATKNLSGEWEIEPVELFRVYTPVNTNGYTNGSTPVHSQVSASPQPVNGESTPGLLREIELLRELLSAKEDVIADLRQRLDAEAEERRRLTAVLEALTPPQPRPGRSWWARLLGGE